MSLTYSLPRTSGIYLITCTANNKIYIGSTSNLRKRQHDHFADMRRGAHSNKHMQSACNKYGIDVFTFEVLEYVMPFIRIEREQHWLDKLKPYDHAIGFNVATHARGDQLSAEHRSNISKANMGHSVSKQAREKLRIAHTGKTLTDGHRRKISIANKGHVMSAESKALLAEKRSKVEWLVTKPDGTTLTVVNLKQFCRDNKLNSGHMFQVAKSNRLHHKGWKCHKISPV